MTGSTWTWPAYGSTLIRAGLASSRKKRAVRPMVAHGARFSVYQIMFGSRKWEFRKCEMNNSVMTTLVFACPRTRIYCKFSFTTATDFLTPSEFSHDGNTMTKIRIWNCLQGGASGSSFFFGLLPINIFGNTDTAIHRNHGANFFTHSGKYT
jgi:hypothetical protein